MRFSAEIVESRRFRHCHRFPALRYEIQKRKKKRKTKHPNIPGRTEQCGDVYFMHDNSVVDATIDVNTRNLKLQLETSDVRVLIEHYRNTRRPNSYERLPRRVIVVVVVVVTAVM